MNGTQGDPDSVELRLGENDNGETQLDAATAVAAAFFGNPLNLSFARAAAAETQASFLQRQPEGEWTIGGSGGGSLSNRTPQQKHADEQDEELDELIEAVERIDREERRYAEEVHRFRSVEMTGEEWSEMGEQLAADTPLRRYLRDKLKREGKSEAEADRLIDASSRVSTLMSKPTLTEAEKAELANAPAGVDAVLKDAQEFQKGLHAGQHSELQTTTAGGQQDSVDARARTFASAPDLGASYRRAIDANEPLDKPNTVQPLPASAPSSPELMMSGFA